MNEVNGVLHLMRLLLPDSLQMALTLGTLDGRRCLHLYAGFTQSCLD